MVHSSELSIAGAVALIHTVGSFTGNAYLTPKYFVYCLSSISLLLVVIRNRFLVPCMFLPSIVMNVGQSRRNAIHQLRDRFKEYVLPPCVTSPLFQDIPKHLWFHKNQDRGQCIIRWSGVYKSWSWINSFRKEVSFSIQPTISYPQKMDFVDEPKWCHLWGVPWVLWYIRTRSWRFHCWI